LLEYASLVELLVKSDPAITSGVNTMKFTIIHRLALRLASSVQEPMKRTTYMPM
jgi:hypothetical protein